jgi:hypothetical protein
MFTSPRERGRDEQSSRCEVARRSEVGQVRGEGAQPAKFVMACDKRGAFTQGSGSDEAIQPFLKLWIASLALAMTHAARSDTPMLRNNHSA